MIRIHDKQGRVIECTDAREAIAVLEHLHAQDKKAVRHRVPGVQEVVGELFSRALGGYEETNPWTLDAFFSFLDSLKEPQKQILSLLVKRRKLTDEELRKALKLDSNLELGGVLSGVSKQAAAVNVPARAVFTIENETKGGETTKNYVVAVNFLRMAIDANWPGD